MKIKPRAKTNTKEEETKQENICRMKDLKVKSKIKVGASLYGGYYGMYGGMYGGLYGLGGNL